MPTLTNHITQIVTHHSYHQKENRIDTEMFYMWVNPVVLSEVISGSTDVTSMVHLLMLTEG
jgi:hypothetical protein